MDKCYSAIWESCSLTDDSVTLLWCNPPCDDDRHSDEKQLELAFLKSTMPKLERGGVLALVIQHCVLQMAEIARYLAIQYEHRTVLRFPDGDIERFMQILLLATRREMGNVSTFAVHQPLYDPKTNEEKLAILSRLGKQRKPLPGQVAPGLPLTQNPTAIADARVFRIHQMANPQSEIRRRKMTYWFSFS